MLQGKLPGQDPNVDLKAVAGEGGAAGDEAEAGDAVGEGVGGAEESLARIEKLIWRLTRSGRNDRAY